MEFKDVLNRYMERTGCSARDLAERSGLSTATISRYRSGDRVPEADSRQLENLAKGIAAIAAEKKIREMEEEAVRQALSEQAQGPGIEIEKLRLNFDTLLNAIVRAKPAASKGQYIRSCVVASTMGPGIKINPAKVG